MKELLYAVPPHMENAGEAWGLIPARMAWRVSGGPKLMALDPAPAARGGAMYVACSGAVGSGDPTPCCGQIAGECRRRGFDRVICDLEGEPSGELTALVQALGRICAKNSLTLYLPEQFAPLVPDCMALVSSVVTDGTLERRLRGALERFGPERTVLAIEAGAMDFRLPAAGEGRPVTPEALKKLMERMEPAVFFDRGLCAHYFTYMVRGGEAHFMLFDTPRSVREKLEAAQRLELRSALLAAPQVEGWLGEIFG